MGKTLTFCGCLALCVVFIFESNLLSKSKSNYLYRLTEN